MPNQELKSVFAWRAKVASLGPREKRIWELAHTMLNEMMSSENADIQGCYKSSARHHDASKKAEEELLELLNPAPPRPANELSCGCEVGVCICDFEKD